MEPKLSDNEIRELGGTRWALKHFTGLWILGSTVVAFIAILIMMWLIGDGPLRYTWLLWFTVPTLCTLVAVAIGEVQAGRRFLARYKAGLPPEPETYKTWARCQNCGRYGTVRIPKGQPLSEAKCPQCDGATLALAHSPLAPGDRKIIE